MVIVMPSWPIRVVGEKLPVKLPQKCNNFWLMIMLNSSRPQVSSKLRGDSSMSSYTGLLRGLTWLAASGGSAVAAQSSQYGLVFGTGYNATTQYFNKNSSVTYTDGNSTDFFTIALGLDALNSTGPTGSIFYEDLESGTVLAKSELLPQGSIFTGGPSYSIANVTKVKTWRLPQTYSKMILCYFVI